MLSHVLTADDIENGKTLTLSDIDPSETEVYVDAFVDTNNDSRGGELIECYRIWFCRSCERRSRGSERGGGTAITINLDMVLEMP